MPEPTERVRVVRREFRYDREHYTRGDELEVHEGALEKHPRTLERVEEVSNDDEYSVEDLDPHPSGLVIDDLEDRLEDVDDPALLKTIKTAEEETKDRGGAKEAIDARINELED